MEVIWYENALYEYVGSQLLTKFYVFTDSVYT